MSDSINNLLGASIDDLADLPEFGTFPSGAHKVIIFFEKKEVNKKPCIEAKMQYVELVELANDEDAVPAAKAEGTVLFMLDNEFGQGNLKAVMKPLAAHFGTSSIAETMAAAKGAEVTVTIKTKPDKKDATVMRMNISKLEV